jgi:capsular polysaccharide biosynthesis protein
VPGTLEALRAEAAGLRQTIDSLRAQLAETQIEADRLEARLKQVGERARLAGMPFARLGSDRLVLEGPSRRRLRINRLTVGDAVEHPVASRLGVVESATANPHVQALWDSLNDRAVAPGQGALTGAPSTVLDVPGAVVRSEDDGRTLRISMTASVPSLERADVVAVPKFTFDFAPRKLRNFGHWLLDCVPQAVVLSALAPAARLLLPSPLRGFQRATLDMVGVAPARAVAWDGGPIACDRLLVFESDGRAGGRPLSALLETRRLLTARGAAASRRGTRRIYVSRRDAEPKRRWVDNEAEIEALFASRGFEVLVMADCPLEEQLALFRDAYIVAGVSGAGLSDIVFSAPDTHVVVLLTDSLMQWYADQRGSRSSWLRLGGLSDRPLSVLGDSPHFYVQLAAAFGQYCHCFLGGDHMPIPPLSAFLDRVLEHVEQS